MSDKTIRLIIAVLGLYTAIVHLVILNLDGLEPLFILNGLGYFALLGALLFRIPAGQQRLLHYAYMAFALVTIIAYFVVNGAEGFASILGLSTKAVEVLLIVFLWLDLKKLPA
ncbi:MAG: hypothetical protein M1347_05295 [Chloroflexi bacterium]|nr:hypothetical protein [Chloroflexota bacterium]